MKISACVIVKNEEKNIGQWLNNMRQIADEIVVVDTGSTDNTINILENAGITPYHFTWCNDFAAAKNYAIQQATGDWIVFLDADEYITMLDGIILYGSQEMLLKYLQLAQGMPGSKLKKTGHKLVDREYYGEALEIFAQIQAEDEAVTEEFWLDCGICLYYLQDYSNAMAALEKAAEMGNSSNDLKSYIAWCKEADRE